MVLSPRRYSTIRVSPIRAVPTRKPNSRDPSTDLPSIPMTTSPRRNPAANKGLWGCSFVISVPSGRASPRLSARSGVTSCNSTPSQGRLITLLPDSAVCTTTSTMSEGIENPMPIEPPERENMAVLIPTSSPCMLTRAPPELPGLMAASV